MHAIVSPGGLTESGWKSMNPKYLFPVKVMGDLLCGKMLTLLRQAHQAGKLPGTSTELEQLLRRLKQHNWVVYVKKAFRHAEHVLKYLGRYTHRVALSNSRFVAISQEAVTFRTKEGKATTLRPVEFLRRFLQHILPKGFQKMLRSDTAPKPSADGVLNAARTSFVSRPGLPPRRYANEQLRHSLGPEIHPLMSQENMACPSIGDRCPALARWQTDQSAWP